MTKQLPSIGLLLEYVNQGEIKCRFLPLLFFSSLPVITIFRRLFVNCFPKKLDIDISESVGYNSICQCADRIDAGVWLSLARVLDLGSRGRRFKSCHPD